MGLVVKPVRDSGWSATVRALRIIALDLPRVLVPRIARLTGRWLWFVFVILPWVAIRFPFYFVAAVFEKRPGGNPNDQSPYAGQEAVAKRLAKIQAWQPGDPTAGEGDLKYRLEHWKAR